MLYVVLSSFTVSEVTGVAFLAIYPTWFLFSFNGLYTPSIMPDGVRACLLLLKYKEKSQSLFLSSYTFAYVHTYSQSGSINILLCLSIK